MKRARPSPSDAAPERLIEATIQQIEQHGLGQLTIRGVAGAAGMNVAAVNYYFRSKDALVAAALDASLQNLTKDTEDFLTQMPGDPVRVFGELLGYLLEGALRFPRLSKAHLHDAFVNESSTGPFPRLFTTILLRLQAIVRSAVPGLDKAAAGRRVVAAISAVFFPASFAGMYRSVGALDSAADRTSYVHEIARNAFAPLGEG